MITLDEDALICDLAETYRIYNYKALPLQTVGVLACGLRDNSRIKMKMSDMKVDSDTILNAIIADRLAVISWQIAGDANNPHPESIYQKLMGYEKETNNMSFDTGDDFLEYRETLLRNIT